MKKYRNFIPLEIYEKRKLIEEKSIKRTINLFILLNLVLFTFIFTFKKEEKTIAVDNIKTEKKSSIDTEEVLEYINLAKDISEFTDISNGKGTIITDNIENLEKINKNKSYVVFNKGENRYEINIK